MKRRRLPPRAIALVPLLLLLAGCERDPDPDRWLSFGIQPFVMVAGAPNDLSPGFGAEVSFTRLVPLDIAVPIGYRARLAWSHHNGEPGWSDAEYFRLGLAGTLRFFRPISRDEKQQIGLIISAGPALHYIWAHGPGDVAGLGISLEPEFWFILRERYHLAVRTCLEGWLHSEGGAAGTFSVALTFGVNF